MRLIGWILLFGLLLSSCKNDKIQPSYNSNYLEARVNTSYGGSSLYLDSAISLPNGDRFKITDLKFYAQSITSNGSEILDAALFDLRERNDVLFRIQTEENQIDNINFNVGVAADVNHLNPVDFPSNSWLNLLNANDMFWDWTPGYIFVKIEGVADTINDGNDLFDHTISYHLGKDANIRSFTKTNITCQAISSYKNMFYINLDLQKVFETGTNSIDIRSQNSTHSEAGNEQLTQEIMDNFVEGLQ